MPLSPEPRPATRQAFSMIELLAVVAIIGVLAAIIFPNYRSVMQRAGGTKCASNLRQISVAVGAYAAENNGAFPRGGWYNGSGDVGMVPLDPPAANNIGWLTDIYPFLNSRRDVFVCPSGPTVWTNGGVGQILLPGMQWSDANSRYPQHYGYNAQLNSHRREIRDSTRPDSTTGWSLDRMAAAENLSGIPVMIELVYQNNFYGGTASAFNATPPATTGQAFAARHSATGNVLWADGSVSAHSRAEWAGKPEALIPVLGNKRLRFCIGEY